MSFTARSALKAIRAWRPVNAPATYAVRSVSRLTGRSFEGAIKHLPRSGAVRSALPNGETLRLESRGDDWVSNQVFWRGWRGYEPEMSPLFFRLAETAEVVLDVGAYVGFYALIAGLANRRARVFAFEPMPESAGRLRRHLELNDLDNVELIVAAVSCSDGEAELFHAGHLPTAPSLVAAHSSESGMGSSTVRTVALESILEERDSPPVSLAKIDVEGGEPEVLRGMGSRLERDRPTIFCEVLPGDAAGELERLLRPLGYSFFHLTPDGPIESAEIRGHPQWLNWLFTVMTRERLDALTGSSSPR